MSEIRDEIEAEASRPRRIFLALASITMFLAVLVYLYEDVVIETMRSDTSSGQLAFAILLIFLVIATMVLIMCYRSPRLGNRMLGYDAVLMKAPKGDQTSVHYSAGFGAETGSDTKRRNTQRKQHRSERRRLAKVTREMQQKRAEEAQSKSDD
ncbi:MAG: hypothetical protein COB37_09085 [Kordiimonadales bacterium]|nr:MAG: hypothetical protein COB37_09085 [Kordiimonadales bacterium]